jgi:hypothetical protein
MNKHSAPYAHEQSELDITLDNRLNELRNPKSWVEPVPAKPPVTVVRVEKQETPLAESLMIGAGAGMIAGTLFGGFHG